MRTSVVIPTYNGQRYLVEQLRSIKEQSQPVDEVIISDDRSTDKTVDVARDFINKNHLSNWHVYINKENKGWRENFMDAMWKSHGDYVFPCDQDDIWRKDKVSVMTHILDEHPEVNVLASNWVKFSDKTDKKKTGPFTNDGALHRINLYRNYMLVKCPGCVYCVRRLVLDWARDYWKSDYPHDALLWRLGLFSNSLFSINKGLHFWRMHNDSTFAIESRNLKTIKEKQKWIKTATSMNEAMKKFIVDIDSPIKDRSLKLLKRYSGWLQARRKFYNSRSIWAGLRLLPYWDCYPRRRQYLGDWFIIFIKRK